MKKKIIATLSVLMVALIAVNVVSNIDFVKNNNNYVDKTPIVDTTPPSQTKPVYHYAPDWETNIFELKEYTDRNLNLTFGRLDGRLLTFSETLFTRAECQTKGGSALALMYDYFDLLRHGDHEAVNELFRDDYFDDEEKEKFPEKPFEKFPMQKIYDVLVCKYDEYEDKNFDNLESMEPTYYIIEYKIMENDGYFHHGLESESYATQLVGILTYADGTSEIYLIIDTPNVSILK